MNNESTPAPLPTEEALAFMEEKFPGHFVSVTLSHQSGYGSRDATYRATAVVNDDVFSGESPEPLGAAEKAFEKWETYDPRRELEVKAASLGMKLVPA